MSSSVDPMAELELAIELADACDRLTLPSFEDRAFTVERKLDRSEVTEIDRRTEQLVAEQLAAARPEHGLLGEEHGLQGAATSPWRWVVDPIDGTSGFVRGIPVWATLIALMNVEDGSVVVGVVSAPALGRRWWSAAGAGTFVNGTPCRVSDVDRIDRAQISVTFSPGWDDLGLTGELVRLAQGGARARGFGDFWQHALVAEGAVDIAVDAVGVAVYDIAAVSLLVREAGGEFTDRQGAHRLDTGTAISTNGVLHAEVVQRLSGPDRPDGRP